MTDKQSGGLRILANDNSVRWRSALVSEEKERIKEELAQLACDEKARLKYILCQIHELADTQDSMSLLRRYIYVMSALVHNERHGGLSSKEIHELFKMGHGILRVKGLDPFKTKLGFLFGDLYQVSSQIYKRNGQQWMSAWQQILSSYSTERFAKSTGGIPSLALGIRSLRLGNTQVSSEYFRRALDQGLSRKSTVRAHLELVKAYRLQLNFDGAKKHIDQALELELTREESDDFAWEGCCIEATENGDLRPLVNASKSRVRFLDFGYLLETSLWVRAHQLKKWSMQIPKIESAVRKHKGARQKYGFWYEAVKTLEECYDSEIPFSRRLEKLGRVLDRSWEFYSIDKELLFWAAASRWLLRCQSTDFLNFVLEEYYARSMRVSGGKTNDAIQVLGDVVHSSREEQTRDVS